MSEIIDITASPPLNRSQRWNSYLVVVTVVGALLLGLSLRRGAINATQTYEDLESGVRAQLPSGWLLSTGGSDYIFRAEDPNALPFKTLLQVSVVAVGPDAVPDNILDQMTISRPQSLSAYRVISVTDITLRDGSPAKRMVYAYTQDERNPFLESLPIVVQGMDVVVLRGSQAVILTYREEQSAFAAHRYRFDNLLQTLEIF